MNLNLNHPLRRLYMAPEPGDTGGDRGDDFTPTDPDAGKGAGGDTEAATAAALEAKLTEEAAAAKATETAGEGGEGTDEEKAAAAADKTKGKDTRIPLARHKEVLEKERTVREGLERELAKYQKGAVVAEVSADITKLETSVGELEAKYNELISDGKTAEATKVMSDIRRTERELTEMKSDLKVEAATARAIETTRYFAALERVEASYPALNPDHEDYDPAVFAEVVEMKEAYQLKGYTPTQALQKAVAKELGAATAKQKDAVTVAPRVDATDAAALAAAARKKAAVDKTVATVEKTPPSTAKVGLPSDAAGGGLNAKALMSMDQESFSKVPEEVLARERGDIL